jgi:hypothetical protein
MLCYGFLKFLIPLRQAEYASAEGSAYKEEQIASLTLEAVNHSH